LYMKRRGFEKVPTKGAVTMFRQRMGTDFNRISARYLRTHLENFPRYLR